MNLINALNGYQFVLKVLKERESYCWNNVIGVNKDERGNPRYYIVIGDSGSDNIFIKFSREFYTSGEGGFRESINSDGGIKECFKDNVKRLFWIYPDGKIYWIKILDFMKLADIRITNNENKKIYTITLQNLERY